MFSGSIEIFSRGTRWIITRSFGLGADQAAGCVSPTLAASKVDEWCESPITRADVWELYEELSGTKLRSPTSAEITESIKPRLRRAFESGELVAMESPSSQRTEKAAAEGAHAQSTKLEPPVPPPPPRRPVSPPKTLHSFAIRLVDEIGSAISEVDLLFTHGGAKEDVATDGNGVARLEDSPVRAATAKILDPKALREALKPRWDQPRGDRRRLDESQGVTVALLAGDNLPSFDLVADKLRIVSVQPFVRRVRLIGGFFDKSKAFVLPTGLSGIRGVVAAYDENPKAKLLVVGHTDTTGKPAYNDALSLERAEATKDYLTDNVDGWLKWYGDDVAVEKRWGTTEDEDMIGALPDADQRGPRENAVRWFQRTRGLKVDGIAGPQTRRALITEYMGLDGTSLPKGIDVVTHGCGENFPADATGDDEADADNRRVEVYFFDGELGVEPPPKGKSSPPGSPEYPEWVRRADTTDHVVAGRQPLRLELVSTDGWPLPEVGFSVAFGDGSSRDGTLDKWGIGKIPDAPEGPFAVSYPDADDLRAKALAARVHHALTTGDMDLVVGVLAQPPDALDRIAGVYARYYNDVSGSGLAVDAKNASAGTPAADIVDHLLALGGLGAGDAPMVVVYTEPRLDPETGGTGTGTAVV